MKSLQQLETRMNQLFYPNSPVISFLGRVIELQNRGDPDVVPAVATVCMMNQVHELFARFGKKRKTDIEEVNANIDEQMVKLKGEKNERRITDIEQHLIKIQEDLNALSLMFSSSSSSPPPSLSSSSSSILQTLDKPWYPKSFYDPSAPFFNLSPKKKKEKKKKYGDLPMYYDDDL